MVHFLKDILLLWKVYKYILHEHPFDSCYYIILLFYENVHREYVAYMHQHEHSAQHLIVCNF